MGLAEAILEGSSLVKEAKQKAAAAGLADGRAEEARRMLRIALKSKFPGLETAPEIDAIQNVDAIESLFQRALASSDPDEIRRAIRTEATESR